MRNDIKSRAHKTGGNGYAPACTTPPAARPVARPRPSGSSPSDPLIVFQTYKIRRSTVEELQAGALEKGWSAAALVRKLLDEWAERRRAEKAGRRGRTTGLRKNERGVGRQVG